MADVCETENSSQVSSLSLQQPFRFPFHNLALASERGQDFGLEQSFEPYFHCVTACCRVVSVIRTGFFKAEYCNTVHVSGKNALRGTRGPP